MAFALQAGGAEAQDEALRFNIPEEPLASALLDFAIQARVSISTGAAAQCRPIAKRLAGRFTPRAALASLLAGTGCSFREIPDGSLIVIKLREPLSDVRPPTPETFVRPPPPEPPQGLQEIVVTAARRTALLDRAPYSISAVGGGELAAEGATDLNDVAFMVAGVTMTDLGPGRDKIFIRGLSDGALTGNTQSTVGIYLNGARITYNAPDPDLRLVDIDRVEVLRGPQGALYGAGSIGGILHIVTRKPALDSYSAGLDTGASATWGGTPSWSVDAVLNAPLAPGRLAVRLVAYDETQGGYIDDVRLGVHDANEVRRRGLRVATLWRPAPDWAVTATVTRQNLNSSDTRYAEPSVGQFARDNYLREPHDNDFLAANVELSGHQGWGDLTATTSVMRHQFDSRYDASLALPLFAPSAAVAPSPFDEANRAELLVNEITAASHDAGRLRWLAGLFQSVGDNDSTSTLTAPIGAGGQSVTVYDEARHDLVNELAGYGQLSYQLTPQLTLTAGGRWFYNSVETRSATTQPLAARQAAFTGKTSTSGFAPQAVLLDRPAKDVTLYAQLSEGYRSGGFNTAGLPGQVFGTGAAGSEPQRRYAGDELWNYEAGAKFALLGGLARVRTAAFYILWKDVQSDQLLANGLPYTANLGDGRDLGWEIDADVQPDDHWRFKANATVAEPELNHPNPFFVAWPDNGLPGVPRFSAGGSASYQVPVGQSMSIRLQTSYAYVGKSHLTLDATTSPPMGDYSIDRISAEFIREHWSMTIFLEGALGAGRDTFAYGDPFNFRSIAQTTPVRPTTVGVQFSARVP